MVMMMKKKKNKNKGRKNKNKKSTQSTPRPPQAPPDPFLSEQVVAEEIMSRDKKKKSAQSTPSKWGIAVPADMPHEFELALAIQAQQGTQYGQLNRMRAPISLYVIAIGAGFFETPWTQHLVALLGKEIDHDLDPYLPYAWSMMAYVLMENDMLMASFRYKYLTSATTRIVKILSEFIHRIRYGTFTGTLPPWQRHDIWDYCWLAAETALKLLGVPLPRAMMSSDRTKHELRVAETMVKCKILSLYQLSPECVCSFVGGHGLIDTLVLISLHMQNNECPGSQIDGLRSLHMIQKYCCGAHLAFVLHRKIVVMIVRAMKNHLLNKSLQILGCKLLEHFLDPVTSPVYQEAWPVVKEAGGQVAASNTFVKHQEDDEVNHAVFCVFFHLLPLPTETYDVD